MKIQQEKPVMNISNLTGGKNEKARRGASVKFVFRLDLLEVFTVSLYIFKLLFLTIMMSRL